MPEFGAVPEDVVALVAAGDDADAEVAMAEVVAAEVAAGTLAAVEVSSIFPPPTVV